MHETQDTGAAKILAILEALAPSGPVVTRGLTVSGLARSLGRDKSSVSRQLRPLISLGLVERDDDGLHRLGWRLFTLATQAGDQRLLLLAPSAMRQLARQVKERVHLSIRRDDEVLTILSEGPYRAVEAVQWVGRTVPVTCTSSGRALLFDHGADEIRTLLAEGFRKGPGSKAPTTVDAVIDRVNRARALGFAAVVDEFDDDLAAVAAPVRDGNGRIVAALNISAPTYRLLKDMNNVGRQVSQATQYLSQALSSPPLPNPPTGKEQNSALPGLGGEMRRIS
ncbi:transcriptional regulator, IclR family [Modestobacter sp. DSM 44400]|uniref:IclR family transcriptional regulator n=1 Tax=Modestobacter sp. DSM 44400 TaxID=1550230 RepID=UPI00089897E9|nr:IclR family transcriptional regulator [Modestobacter sp. DSM 44400]SDY72507.1 transcriptional regulator, IclR family [Modestobacter sp. DSM 44400]